jgi:hypothetical protein
MGRIKVATCLEGDLSGHGKEDKGEYTSCILTSGATY